MMAAVLKWLVRAGDVGGDVCAGRPVSGRRLHIPPRMRQEIPGLFNDPERAQRIEKTVGAIEGVLDVQASTHTGRVLVHLAAPNDAVRERIHQALLEIGDPECPLPPSFGRVADRLQDTARQSIQWIRRVTTPQGNATHAEESISSLPAYHALEIDSVLAALGVDAQSGLSTEKAEQIAQQVGPNVLAGVARRSPFQILAGQMWTVPSGLLGGAALLSVLLGDILEAAAITFVVGVNIAVGYFTEARAEELLDAWGELRVEWARVMRDGQAQPICAANLVPGDVLILGSGDAIAADARLIEASDFTVDESTLTGESEPAEKNILAVLASAPLADRHGMVYAGTTVATGEAKGVVVATGQATEIGAIERALSRAGHRAAPLELQLDGLGRKVASLSFGSSVFMLVVGLLRGQPIQALARSAVALGVAAIPEGFPAVGTTALSLASYGMRKNGIVIRRLAAAETLGAVSTICADKTGTLTENRMQVGAICLRDGRAIDVSWADEPQPDGSLARVASWTDEALRPVDLHSLHDLARIAALNADVELDSAGNITKGSGTERALVEFACAAGYPVPVRRRSARRVREVRRSAERHFMTTFHDHPELGRIELVKGAPEQVIDLCSALPAEQRMEACARNDSMASRGLRVLAFAWRRARGETTEPLEFVGLIGLRDPPRAGVKEALAVLSAAGISTRMLTGDQERTARAIGMQIGIPPEAVQSRVTPDAKLEIVRDLQRKGIIVAMTGDGVNDGPALQAADVGIAMGQRGTDVARAVADVVLAHDDLGSISGAIAEGRRLYDNVRRAIEYLVATNMSEVMVMLAGSVAGVAPLGPLQLLWINTLTDITPALALAIEPASSDIMARPPRDARAPIFNVDDYRRLTGQAVVMATATLGAYGLGALRGGGPGRARTMAFTSLVTMQLLHAQRCRAQCAENNPYLHGSIVVGFGLQAAALLLPGLRSILGTAPLGAVDLCASLVLGVLPASLGTRGGARELLSSGASVRITRDTFLGGGERAQPGHASAHSSGQDSVAESPEEG